MECLLIKAKHFKKSNIEADKIKSNLSTGDLTRHLTVTNNFTHLTNTAFIIITWMISNLATKFPEVSKVIIFADRILNFHLSQLVV